MYSIFLHSSYFQQATYRDDKAGQRATFSNVFKLSFKNSCNLTFSVISPEIKTGLILEWDQNMGNKLVLRLEVGKVGSH